MENVVFDFSLKSANINRLPVLLDTIGDMLLKCGIPENMVPEIQLVLEEAVVNIIIHGYSKKGGYVALSARKYEDCLKIEIRDRGVPFDPGKASVPDLMLSPEEREIGGLGVHLIKEMMDDVSYSYLNSENRLVLVKKLN